MKKTILFFVITFMLSAAGYSQADTYLKNRLDFKEPQKEVAKTLPLIEGFEDYDFPPEGWTVYNVSGGSTTWERRYPFCHSGDASAVHSYASPMQEGWLITPKLSLPEDIESILEFWSYNGFPGDNFYNGIWISTTDLEIESFTSIKKLSGSNEISQSWKKLSVPLDDYAGNEVYLAFKYMGNNADAWFIDDVSVKLAGIDGAAKKLYGAVNLISGEPFIYNVAVENLRGDPITDYTVNLIDEDDNILATNITTPVIAPNETVFVSIPWTPETVGTISLRAVLEIEGDINLSNNTTPTLVQNVLPSSSLFEGTIGTEESLSFVLPVNVYWKHSRTQSIYYDHEIIGRSGKIFQIQYYNNFVEDVMNKPIQIWMANTTASGLDAWLPESEFTLVFDGMIDFPIGHNTITISLDVAYDYSGNNLVIMTNRPLDTEEYSMNNVFYSTLTSDFYYRSRVYNSDEYEFNWTQPGTSANWHPNIVLSIALQPMGSVSGIVTDSTNPVGDATVEIAGTNYKRTTDAEGNFSFDFLLPGTYQFVATKYGYFDTTKEVTVAANVNTETEIVLLSLPKYTISGKVSGNYEPEGVPDVTIKLTGYDNYTVVTDAAGNFSIPNVYGNFTYNIEAKLSGYEIYTSTVTVDNNLTCNIVLNQKIFPVINPVAEIVDKEAVITWEAPLYTDTKSYILDDGSFENGWAISGGFDAWLGNKFEVGASGTLTSIDLYGIQNPNASGKTVTIEIFDENQKSVAVSKPFLIPDNDWMNIPLENVPYSGTFYAMVHWNDSQGSTNWIGTDENGPNALANFNMLLFEEQWGIVHFELGGAPFVFMIRANANENSKSVSYGNNEENEGDASKALLSYAIYRLNEGMPETSWTELSTSVSELLYTDNDWSVIPNGKYQYAVKAVYSGNIMSEAKLTNVVVKDEVQIEEKQLNDVLVYSYLNFVYIKNAMNIPIKMVEITDIFGRVLHQSSITNIETVIPLQVPNGIYFVRLISHDDKSNTSKISINY